MATKNTTKAELEAQLAALQQELAAMKAAGAAAPVTAPQPAFYVPKSTDVTLVYMDDAEGYMEVGDLRLNATRFGEQFIISRSQFDALVGKYRNWFDRGILAVSSKDIEVAAQKGLRTEDEYGIDANKLSRLGSMSASEIEKFWNSLTTDAHRKSIVIFFKRKFIENVEPGYHDRTRIDVLDRLTSGGFSRERTELSGGSIKIQPTKM